MAFGLPAGTVRSMAGFAGRVTTYDARLAPGRSSGTTGRAFHPQDSTERFQSCSKHLLPLSQACLAQGSRPGLETPVVERASATLTYIQPPESGAGSIFAYRSETHQATHRFSECDRRHAAAAPCRNEYRSDGGSPQVIPWKRFSGWLTSRMAERSALSDQDYFWARGESSATRISVIPRGLRLAYGMMG